MTRHGSRAHEPARPAETSVSGGVTTSPSTAAPISSPCPLPSDLRRLDDLCVTGIQAPARFWREADVRGKDSATIEMGRVREGEPYFSPTVLIGSPGQAIRLTISNALPGDPHTFTIDEQSIDELLEQGQSAAVTVTFPNSGLSPSTASFIGCLGNRASSWLNPDL